MRDPTAMIYATCSRHFYRETHEHLVRWHKEVAVDDAMRVVSGAIIREDRGVKRVLLGQRRSGGSYPLLWCTLGGKVEEGETDLQALDRELWEEARAQIHAPWKVLYEHEGTSVTTGKPFRLTCFVTPVTSGEAREAGLRPMDGIIGIGWFTAHEVMHLHLAAGDDANREKLIEVLR